MSTRIVCRIAGIYFLVQFFISNKAQSQESQGQKYKREVENAARDKEDKERFKPKTNRTNTNTTSAKTSVTKTNNTEFLPSAEAQKAFEDAKNKNDERIKIATASVCVCNTSPYSEVKFIYSTPVNQKKYGLNERSQELFDIAKQLNASELLSGYLLNIKGEGKQVVVVEGSPRNGSGKIWKPYLITWDKYNRGIQWGFDFNIEIPGTGNYATLTDKLKYIEKAIPNEQDRKAAEMKRNAEVAKKKGEDDEMERKSQLSNIKYLEPYKVMYVGSLEGFKLDIKNYPLGPDEEFVTFFVSKEGLAASQTIYNGKVYKVIIKKGSGYFYTADFLSYANIIPTELVNELANDPIKYKILERMVNLELSLIGTYENEKLEQAEKKYFQETLNRLETREKKKADDLRKGAEEKSTFGVKTISSLIYAGNFYGEKMNGVGCISSGGNSYSSGVFINNSQVCGIGKSGGIKRIYQFNTGLSSPLPLVIYEDGKKGVNDYKFAESNFGEGL